jgi:protein-tyrosine phosphatase
MRSVLFVCLGNICRSPLAQGIFEHKIRQLRLENAYYADSAGTSSWHAGEPPHPGSIRVARKYGIQIEHQRSRPVHAEDGKIFDYIIAMDTANRQALLSEFRFPEHKVHLIRDFSLRPGNPKGLSVPDPWGMHDDAFENVYSILDDAVAGFIAHLRDGKI